ncbi:hypothetical protein SAMN06265348_1307 [Pedobacter westerhofensis]|uniref:Uncharacterized protein n=1 Tax=Pedobacter westerhofensis TaxID=425512 RepID=A0A521FUV3_9SPHI|nr:hypothetical protein SAMN06265348_1307 [Pedobacter westerhofensis]
MNQHLAIIADPRYVKRRELFEIKLAAIQQRNDYWFKHRVNMTTGEYPDRIYNYFRYCYDHQHNIDLYLKENLLAEIKQECLLAFNEIFRPQ